jgi:hypothetical protein
VLYFGSYYELDIRLSDKVITIRTQDNHVKKGDTVNLILRN